MRIAHRVGVQARVVRFWCSKDGDGLRCIPKICAAAAKVGLFMLGLGGKRASRSVWMRRMRSCHRCILFNRAMCLCGTPGDDIYDDRVGKSVQMGCLCRMDLKAGLLKSNCWAWENLFIGIGWPDELNGDQITDR